MQASQPPASPVVAGGQSRGGANRTRRSLRKRSLRSLVWLTHARLENHLPAYRRRLERLIAGLCPDMLVSPAGCQPECRWAVHALDLLDCAEEALDSGRAELGWRCLHEAERMELHGLALLAQRGDSEPLRVRGQSIAFEAGKKLKGWRKQTVEKLLGDAGNPQWTPHVCNLTESHHILTEGFANTYQMLRSQRRQVGVLAGVAIAGLLTWWIGIGTAMLSSPVGSGAVPGVARFPAELLASILLFGVIGAAISGIASLTRKEPETIPSQLTAWTGSLARVVVGAVAALVIFLALESTVLDGADSRLILLQSFVAGFSERLLSAAVDKAGG
jgi:hypothetical protein